MTNLTELNDQNSPKVDFDNLPYEQRKEIIEQLQILGKQTNQLIQASIDANKRNNKS